MKKGDYEIHVFSSYPSDIPNIVDIVDFAITIFGPLDNTKNGDFIEFKKATKCIPLSNDFSGECNQLTTNNDCFNLLYGRSCQNEAHEFYPDIPREIIKVPPYGIKYVALDYPFFAYNSVTYKITPVSLFDPKVSIFYKDVSKGHLSEIEADLIASKKDFISTYVMEDDVMPESDIYALAMIYNTSPYPTDFVISAEYEAYEGPDGPIRPTASSKPSIENGDDSSWKKNLLSLHPWQSLSVQLCSDWHLLWSSS